MKFCYNLSIFFIVICAMVSSMQAGSPSKWTSLHKKIFTKAELQQNKKKKELIFSKDNVMSFSQLIFSWNAFRPKRGHFTFLGQVRDARTKKWQPWHKMAEWGAHVQKSFLSKTLWGTDFFHVRLETKSMHMADAFRIKIVAHGDADMTQLRSVGACLSNFSRFRSEGNTWAYRKLPFACVKNVPRLSQMILAHEKANVMCSPTSCSMLVGYLLRKKVDPLSFARRCFDIGLEAYGSWPFNTAHAFELCQGKAFFYTTRLNSFTDLHQWLSLGIPVAVSVRGGLPGGARAYSNGHLMLVVGWNPKNNEVIVHDPAFESNHETLTRYPLKEFLAAWGKSKNLVYLAYPLNSLKG